MESVAMTVGIIEGGAAAGHVTNRVGACGAQGEDAITVHSTLEVGKIACTWGVEAWEGQ